MRVENIKDPSDHIPALLERVKPEYLTKTYQLCPHVDPCENPCSYTDRETMKHMDEDERACKKNRYTTVCIHCSYIYSKKCAKNICFTEYVHVLWHNVCIVHAIQHDRKESSYTCTCT